MTEATPVWPAGAALGEGVLWSARDDAVYWVDILGNCIHRLSLATGARTTWNTPENIGWIIERREMPGFIVGLKSGFAECTLEPLTFRSLGPLEPDLPDNRMNDATADPTGRIWAGTMDKASSAASSSGSLYRLDLDGVSTRVDTGYTVTNGPAISPDGAILYHTDTLRGSVYRFEISPEGTLRNKQLHIQFEEAWGAPDGMTVDAGGGLWIAHWGGGRVSRFSPQGVLERHIAIPTPNVTKCCFAGANLDRMFVTTAAVDTGNDPLAGSLFEVDPGAVGLPTQTFGG